MYKNLTTRARAVMRLACEEAQRLNHEYVGTEHILLGLVAEGSGVAASVLKTLGVHLPDVRRLVEKIVQPGPDLISLGQLPQTPRAKMVIEFAVEESRKLGHNYVGTEHLLLGILQEFEGVAAQVLMNFGLRLNTVRQEVLNLLGHSARLTEIEADIDLPEVSEQIDPNLQHLPEPAREIVAEFDCQIDVIQEEKEEAVAEQDWDEANRLRVLGDKLKKLRAEFVDNWE